MSGHRATAKRLLWHYVSQSNKDVARDPDCKGEVEFIVDEIIKAAVEEVKAELTKGVVPNDPTRTDQ